MVELTKEQVAKALEVDSGGDIIYGHDVDGMYYPRKFATVSFCLKSTDILIELADKLRLEAGHLSVLPPAYRDYGGESYDYDGYYNFYYGLNLRNGPSVDNYIECVVQSTAEDDEHSYLIPLSNDAKEEAWKVLDPQLKDAYGMGCAELLEESMNNPVPMTKGGY